MIITFGPLLYRVSFNRCKIRYCNLCIPPKKPINCTSLCRGGAQYHRETRSEREVHNFFSSEKGDDKTNAFVLKNKNAPFGLKALCPPQLKRQKCISTAAKCYRTDEVAILRSFVICRAELTLQRTPTVALISSFMERDGEGGEDGAMEG